MIHLRWTDSGRIEWKSRDMWLQLPISKKDRMNFRWQTGKEHYGIYEGVVQYEETDRGKFHFLVEHLQGVHLNLPQRKQTWVASSSYILWKQA